MMERLRRRLREGGLAPYEISSHARPGREAVHNRRYWQRRPVLGVGVGAWSTEAPDPTRPHGARLGNERDFGAWLARVEAGAPRPAEALEVLDASTARSEALFLALRTREGLDAAGFEAEFGGAPRAFQGKGIQTAVEAGLLLEDGAGNLRLSERGVLLSDSVFTALMEPTATLD
jgi:oxygen-independent coproporphyrinogen-3 oxidase